MRVILKPGRLVVAPETEADREAFAAWRAASQDHVFRFSSKTRDGGAFCDLGPHDDACRKPINIVFDRVGPDLQPISNLAHTPFVLRGRIYASVEGFWQGLRFTQDGDRARIAQLWGTAAKRAAHGVPAHDAFLYDGEAFTYAGPRHRALMFEACRAKFTQNVAACDALIATGDRPLTHLPRRDSTTIPGALMAECWMRLRADLRKTAPPEAADKATDV